MDQTITAELEDLLGKAELESVKLAIDAYDEAVLASGNIYVDSVSQGISSADVVYAHVVSSTAAAYA